MSAPELTLTDHPALRSGWVPVIRDGPDWMRSVAQRHEAAVRGVLMASGDDVAPARVELGAAIGDALKWAQFDRVGLDRFWDRLADRHQRRSEELLRDWVVTVDVSLVDGTQARRLTRVLGEGGWPE